MWLMEDAPAGFLQSTEVLVAYVLFVNFASIHTTSMVRTQTSSYRHHYHADFPQQFTHAMYDLAVHPECVDALRGEAAAVLQKHGWTRSALEKMPKFESFMRESARLNPTNLGIVQLPSQPTPASDICAVSLPRQLLKDWTFSNGVTVKKGSFVAASTFSTHWDEEIYPDARTFKPWRFFHEGDETGKDRFTSTGNEFMSFGAGKHAW